MIHFTKRKKYLILSILLTCSAFVFSQENEILQETSENQTVKITVEDAVNQALKTHIDIQRGSIILNQKEREKNHSWNSILPSVNISASGSDSSTWKNSQTNTISVSAGIDANLSLNFGLADKIKKIKSDYEAQEISFEATIRSTESAVRQSFYNLLYLKEKWNSAKSTLDSYERTYNQTQAKYNRGLSSQLDLLTAQVNYETAKPNVDSAESNYTNALMQFIDTVGFEFDLGIEIELEGTLDIANDIKDINHDVIKKNISNSPEIKTLEANLKSAEYAKKSSLFEIYFPSLSLGANYTPELWSKETKSGTSLENPSWSASIGISVPIGNLIPGSSARDSVATLDDTVKDYELQLENKQKTIRTSADAKLKDIELSKKTLEARRLNLQLAEQSYEMTEEAYSRGTKDLLALQSSLDTLENAQVQLKENQYTLISNVLELENMLGLDLETYFEK